MLVTVIIFLREALEAALILSVLLAVSFRLLQTRKWIIPASCIGFIGGCIVALYLGEISDLIDGTGQEVMNASFLLSMTILTSIICIWLSRNLFGEQLPSQHLFVRFIKRILIVHIGIAIMHEGSELFMYSYSYSLTHENSLSLVIGGGLGLGIGASLGAFVYYFLINLERQTLIKVSICILMLVSAGMASQAALYLIQSGWLPSQLPLWDTSNIIPERSIIGQLLYAMIGYEATPSSIQVSFYFAAILLCILSIFTCTKMMNSK